MLSKDMLVMKRKNNPDSAKGWRKNVLIPNLTQTTPCRAENN
jgi:hypothetical protein